jgi:hypothetical protein
MLHVWPDIAHCVKALVFITDATISRNGSTTSDNRTCGIVWQNCLCHLSIKQRFLRPVHTSSARRAIPSALFIDTQQNLERGIATECLEKLVAININYRKSWGRRSRQMPELMHWKQFQWKSWTWSPYCPLWNTYVTVTVHFCLLFTIVVRNI